MPQTQKEYHHGNCTGSWAKVGANIEMRTYFPSSSSEHKITVPARSKALNAFAHRQQEGLKKAMNPAANGNHNHKSQLQVCFDMAIDARRSLADTKNPTGSPHRHHKKNRVRTNRAAIKARGQTSTPVSF